jgi:hypothetical protein
MTAYKVTEIVFDLDDSMETDFLGENGEVITEDQLQKSLQDKVIGEIFVADEDDEIVDMISDKYGWCVLSSKVEQVPSVEYTIYGLFGGETNDLYRRGEIPILGKTTELAIVRAIKNAIGWNGLRCRKEDYGDSIRLYPSGLLQCCDIEAVPIEE